MFLIDTRAYNLTCFKRGGEACAMTIVANLVAVQRCSLSWSQLSSNRESPLIVLVDLVSIPSQHNHPQNRRRTLARQLSRRMGCSERGNGLHPEVGSALRMQSHPRYSRSRLLSRMRVPPQV